MAVYFIILFLSLLSVLAKEKQIKVFLSLSVLLSMFVLCGMRGQDVGQDTPAYFNVYKYGTSYEEPLFTLSTLLFRYLDLPFYAYTIFIAFLTYFFLYVHYRKTSENIAFSLLIFLTFSVNFFPQTFNVIRQYVAIVLIMCSLDFLLENKKGTALVFFISSMLFHYSAAIIGVLMALCFLIRRIPFWIVLFSVLLSLIFGLTFQKGYGEYASVISGFLMSSSNEQAEYYNRYFDNPMESNYNIIGTLANMLPFSFFTLLLYTKENSRLVLYKFFFLCVLLSNTFFSILYVYRITMYGLFCITTLLPNTINCTSTFKKKGLLILTIFMVLWFIYVLFSNKEDDLAGIMPYKFFFE